MREIGQTRGFRSLFFVCRKYGLRLLACGVVRLGLRQRLTRKRLEVCDPPLRRLLVIAISSVETLATIIAAAPAVAMASTAPITVVSAATAGKSRRIKWRGFGAAGFRVIGGCWSGNLFARKLRRCFCFRPARYFGITTCWFIATVLGDIAAALVAILRSCD